MDNYMNQQTGKELLEKAIKQWTEDGVLDSYDGGGMSAGKKFDKEEEEAITQNLRKDPVINLFMTALAHQTNLLQEQIAGLRTDLVSEFIRKTVPYSLTRPVPAMTLLQAKMVEGAEPYCLLDDSNMIQLEKRSKTKMRFKELEKFSFVPLLKTKILDAAITSVRKTGQNTFELTVSGTSTFGGLSGCSLFFPNVNPARISLSIDGGSLPVLSMMDYERLPICTAFDINHCVFNRSLLYGTTESWMDMLAPFQRRLFYVGDYDEANTASTLTVQLVLDMAENVNLAPQDVLLNCVPVVNVEKGAVTLTADEPIKQIATEKSADIQSPKVSESHKKADKRKSFLQLLAPAESSYSPEQIMLRRFGAERFHAGELLQKAQALVHHYSSDFYAFRAFADVDFDDKMNLLRLQLNEIEGIIGDGRTAHSGVYVMLQKRDQDCFTGGQQRIEVAYLLTDGPRANDIGEGGAIILPPMLDAKETRLLMPTFGGVDEMTDDISLDLMAKYYHLSKDRIITKADVKNFCVKELVCFYRLRSDQIKGIDVTRDDEVSSQTMVVTVTIEPNPTQEIPDGQLNRMASELAQKINLRTTGFCSYTVVIKELDVC